MRGSVVKRGMGAVVAAALGIGVPVVVAGQAGGSPPARYVVEAPNGPWSLKRGERVRATTADGRLLDGRVLAQTDSDVVIGTPVWLAQPRGAARASYADLVRIEARRPPRHREMALTIGFTSGLALGAYLGAQSVHTECTGGGTTIGPCLNRGTAGFLGGVLGAGLGASTAMLVSRPRWQLLSVSRRVDPESITPR